MIFCYPARRCQDYILSSILFVTIVNGWFLRDNGEHITTKTKKYYDFDNLVNIRNFVNEESPS